MYVFVYNMCTYVRMFIYLFVYNMCTYVHMFMFICLYIKDSDREWNWDALKIEKELMPMGENERGSERGEVDCRDASKILISAWWTNLATLNKINKYPLALSLKVKLPYDPICPSVGQSDGRSDSGRFHFHLPIRAILFIINQLHCNKYWYIYCWDSVIMGIANILTKFVNKSFR